MPAPHPPPSPLCLRPACAAAAARRSVRLLGIAGLVGMLAACATGVGQRGAQRPGSAPGWERDGPGASAPADLASIADAVPVAEPFRSATMRPYEVLGRSYVPITEDIVHVERGLASWYGRKFHGRPTAIGEPYDMYAMTAAHPTLPLPSYVRVRNPANQREVVLRVNDRGPFHPGRIIDLSYTAAWKLDLLRGVAPVEIERITFSEIRAGNWRRAPEGVLPQRAASAPTPRETALAAQQLLPIAATASEAAAGSGPTKPKVAAIAASAGLGVADPPMGSGNEASPAAAASWWVQLGAFRQRDGAEVFQRRVVADIGWIAPQLQVRSDAELHRLQAGPYADRSQAAEVAERLRASLQLVPVIIERR